MVLPIIIFHIGNQHYVRLCLQQALKSGNTNIILINDNENNFSDLPINVVNYNKYSKNLEKFKTLYKNLSTNNHHIEFLCIVRWMCAYEYMKENNIKRAFICDSDVLIYENLDNIDKNYLHSYDFMLCSSNSKNLTGGQSIWNYSKLQNFVEFIFVFYETQINKMVEWYKNYKEDGGICDMTLLYYFANKQKDFVGLRLPDYPYFSQDLTQIFNNEFTFDLHLGTFGNHPYPDDYEVNTKNRNKNIKFIDGKPYCFCKHLNKDIRFVLLHFQGRNKALMNDWYKLSNV